MPTTKDYNLNELRLLRAGCVDSLLFMTRLFFKEREGSKFIVNHHHKVICDTLDAVYSGDIKRLIINIPPGFTKTELAVKFFVAKGFMLNQRARFLHTSYSSDLALQNSSTIREMIRNPLYQRLNPMGFKSDTKAKARWQTLAGGGLMAAASGGQITGFRAGYMDKDTFSGALIIDDPIKPADALSTRMRSSINDNYNLTLSSRLATAKVPVIVIMQRVHEDDLSGFLLKGGSGETWHHLSIPAYEPSMATDYDVVQFPYGIEIPYTHVPGPTWPYKLDDIATEQLRKASEFVWFSQYQQNPVSLDMQLFKTDLFQRYKYYDAVKNLIILEDNTSVRIEYKKIFADTAMKAGTIHDYSVFQTWGKAANGVIYLLNLHRGKWEAPALESEFRRYIGKHVFNMNVNTLAPRAICVEDKASGIGLIQSLNIKISTQPDLIGLPHITGIPRSVDKVVRAVTAAPEISYGLVGIPEAAPWLADFLEEVGKFNTAMTHKHDDQVDPMMDAIQDMLIANPVVDYCKLVGM